MSSLIIQIRCTRCVLITNILNSSYAIIRRTETGSPCPLASLTWSPSRWHFLKGCREHMLSARVYRRYAYVQQVVVSFTIVHRSCLSRGLERVIRVELCGQCRIYARRQGTSFWFFLYRTTYVSLLNYNTLTNMPNLVNLIPSPNPNIPLSSAISAAESSPSTVRTTTSPQSHPTSSSPLLHSPSYLGT